MSLLSGSLLFLGIRLTYNALRARPKILGAGAQLFVKVRWLRAKEIIRERWREIRNASDGSLLYYAETEPPEGAAL